MNFLMTIPVCHPLLRDGSPVESRELRKRTPRIVVAHQDIHEQKQAELQLREAETFTNYIVDNLPNMIFVKEAQSSGSCRSV
ncbi:MAG: hypothetical protein R3B83_03810 [Nitrospirales bacterium]|nr:hypothetical protein [Nitrospirales bacterium]